MMYAAAFLLVLCTLAPTNAAVDMFLRIDGVPGESMDSQRRGEIDLQNFSFGASKLRTAASQFKDMTFTKYVDTASPKLLLAVATGKQFPTAVVLTRRTGGVDNTSVYVSMYRLSGVQVTSVSTQGSGDRPVQTVTLGFAKIEYAYRTTDAAGRTVIKECICFDVALNAACTCAPLPTPF